MAPTDSAPADRDALVATLQAEVRRMEGARPAEEARPWSTGLPPLDALLPGGGLGPGTLVEWFAPGPGSGAGMLALAAVRAACDGAGRERLAWVACDRSRRFY